MPEFSDHAMAVVARLDGVVALQLEVAALDDVTPTLRSVRLAGDVTSLRSLPGQDVMVSVTTSDGRHRWRRYTMRRDASDGLELWVTTDTTGPGASWARSVRLGDTVELIGPRGKIHLDEHAAAHVFIVDESGLAAACAMIESLVAPVRAHLVAPHLDAATTPLVAPGVGLSMTTLPAMTDGRADLLADDLATVLRASGWPALSATAGYVFGELGLTRDVRGVLEALGVESTHLFVKAYWRADQANEDRGEPARA